MHDEEFGGDAACWAHLFEEPDIVHVRMRRVFEPADRHDGRRVLVDRHWPDGLAEGAGNIDLWLPEVAPSDALAQWLAEDRTRWPEFQFRYRDELRLAPAALAPLLDVAREGDLTLLFGDTDHWHNHAVMLKALIEARMRTGD